MQKICIKPLQSVIIVNFVYKKPPNKAIIHFVVYLYILKFCYAKL